MMKKLLIFILLTSCGDITNSTDTTSTSFGGTQASQAQIDYDQYCYGCHIQDGTEQTSVAGKTAAQIQAAINDISEMQKLNFLTEAEVSAIADYICEKFPDSCTTNTTTSSDDDSSDDSSDDSDSSDDTTPAVDPLVEGAALWLDVCAPCHQASNNTVWGWTTNKDRFLSGIQSNSGSETCAEVRGVNQCGMGFLGDILSNDQKDYIHTWSIHICAENSPPCVDQSGN